VGESFDQIDAEYEAMVAQDFASGDVGGSESDTGPDGEPAGKDDGGAGLFDDFEDTGDGGSDGPIDAKDDGPDGDGDDSDGSEEDDLTGDLFDDPDEL
jgi:hypothetical protein